MNKVELKAAIKALGGDLRGLQTQEQLEKRLKALGGIPLIEVEKPLVEPNAGHGGLSESQPAIPEYESVQGVYSQPIGRVSVLPDEAPAAAITNVLGMTAPVQQQSYAGGVSQEDVMAATARHRAQGMQVKFTDGCWEFWVTITGADGAKRKGRMDSGNMSMPLKVILERADFVSLGKPLPVVSPVIVPTQKVAE